MSESPIEVSVVVPFYNPGDVLRNQLDRIVEVFTSKGVTFEVFAVSDGSTDGSESHVLNLKDNRIRLEVLTSNCGKGEALRVGLKKSQGKYIGFIDADGDIDPSHIGEYWDIAKAKNPPIIMGSKRHGDSVVNYPLLRRLYSWGYHRLVHLLFKLDVQDTQTGLKLLRRDVVNTVLPKMLEKRFAFDLEFLVVAKHLGYTEVIEAPVIVKRHFSSTVSLLSVIGMVLDTFAIWYRLHVVRHYDNK